MEDSMNKNWLTRALPGLLMVGLSGCFFVSDDDDDYTPLGTLTVEWSIDDATFPEDCAAFGVDRMELLVYAGRDLIDEVEPLCEAFSVSIDLPEGVYDADATLVDSFDRSATLTEPIDAIDIIAGTELVVNVDFPVGSFL
jgi:hypothetical protein